MRCLFESLGGVEKINILNVFGVRVEGFRFFFFYLWSFCYYFVVFSVLEGLNLDFEWKGKVCGVCIVENKMKNFRFFFIFY